MATIRFSTPHGDFSIQLLNHQAPETCEYFSELARKDELVNSNIFRIVNKKNNEHHPELPIEIVQLGPIFDMDNAEKHKDKVTHESTETTGLTHSKWSVSAARFEAGFLYKSLFICMRDEPELDATGSRNNDGKGFAVFGKISDGFNVLEHIFSLAEDNEMLANPIEILATKITTT